MVESRSGERQSLTIRVVDPTEVFVQMNDPAVGYLSPTYADLNLNYWYRYYPEQKLLFFKYNACVPRADLPFADFAADLFRTLDSQPVEALVLDLRDNQGGASDLWNPFLEGMKARVGTARFRFYGLISRITASSAMDNAQVMKQLNGAVLVGEDTGGNPEAFGNYVEFKLPNSGLALRVSTRYYTPFTAGITGPSVRPDVRDYRDSSEVFARFDPILFKVLAMADPRAPTGEENRGRAVVSGASLKPGSPQAAGSLSAILGNFFGVDGVTVAGLPAQVVSATGARLDFLQPSDVGLGEQEVAVTRGGDVVWTGTETVAEAAPAIFLRDPADIRSPGMIVSEEKTIRILATGLGLGEGLRVLVGQWDARVMSVAPIDDQPGAWEVVARVPEVDGVSKLMPVVLLTAGRLSNAVTVAIVPRASRE